MPKYSKADRSIVVKHGWKCLADDAVFDVERLLFCGLPVSECSDIVIARQRCFVEPGMDAAFDAHAVVPAERAALESASRVAGCPVTLRQREGGALVFDEDSLTLDSEIETERNGVMTVKRGCRAAQSIGGVAEAALPGSRSRVEQLCCILAPGFGLPRAPR